MKAFALEAEMQGMIAENKQREINKDSLAYIESDFIEIANRMRELANDLKKK